MKTNTNISIIIAAKEHCMRTILAKGAVSEARLLTGKGFIFTTEEIHYALLNLASFGLVELTPAGQWTYTDAVEENFDTVAAAWAA